MFSFCADPTTIDGLLWLSCYLTTGKHMAFYLSFLVVLLLLALAAPAALLFGFAGALACRSSLAPVRMFGHGYITMVRGIPDIAFFLFVPVALSLRTVTGTCSPLSLNILDIPNFLAITPQRIM